MATDAKKNILMYLLVSAVLNAILGVAAIIVWGKIGARSTEIKNQITSLNRRTLSTENLRDNLEKIKIASEQISDYGQRIFPSGDELQLITDLEAIAASNKIVQQITSSNLDNYGNAAVNIVLSANGSYTNVLEYMADLEKYRYLLSINKIELTPTSLSPVDSAQTAVNLRINISLYAKPLHR